MMPVSLADPGEDGPSIEEGVSAVRAPVVNGGMLDQQLGPFLRQPLDRCGRDLVLVMKPDRTKLRHLGQRVHSLVAKVRAEPEIQKLERLLSGEQLDAIIRDAFAIDLKMGEPR